MLPIETTERWHETFPGGHVGVLLIGGVDNTKRSTPLAARKREVEAKLRKRFAGFSRDNFLELEVLRAYRNYYKRFGNTYHVQGQLESVVEGKPLPTVSPLVDANFAAELETFILTAGHDAALLKPPLNIGAAQGGESFTQMNGSRKSLKFGDMTMSDAEGIICTILYGQDRRTPISAQTRRALYVAYAPAGVPREEVMRQLGAVRENVLLFAPGAKVEKLEVYTAGADV